MANNMLQSLLFSGGGGGGGGGGALIVHCNNDEEGVLDKTAQEIYSAFLIGPVIVSLEQINKQGDSTFTYNIMHSMIIGETSFIFNTADSSWSATSGDEYPKWA